MDIETRTLLRREQLRSVRVPLSLLTQERRQSGLPHQPDALVAVEDNQRRVGDDAARPDAHE